MVTTITTAIRLRKALFEQAEILAHHLNISPNDLFESAIEGYLRSYQSFISPDEALTGERENRVINQGDIYWAQLPNSGELQPAIPHPYVILQENVLNHSRIDTVVACALTSNIKRVSDTPGNVLLDAGEANLPRQSVVEVSKVSTIAKAQLGAYIGSLSEPRIEQILTGMRFLQRSFFGR